MSTTTPPRAPIAISSSAELFAQPMAMAAASSALGLGLASQAFGLWIGAVTGGFEVSQRLMGFGSGNDSVDTFRAPRAPSIRAKEVAETLIEDAARTVSKTVESTAKVVEEVADTSVATIETVVNEVVAAPATLLKPVSIDKPETPDDLKAISGIGPKLETVLNDLGIWTYGQIAAWNGEQIAWLDDHLGFRGRIGRDAWLDQARKLSGDR